MHDPCSNIKFEFLTNNLCIFKNHIKHQIEFDDIVDMVEQF